MYAPVTLRGEWHWYATVIGALSCVMIALTSLAPWYGADFDYWQGSDSDYRVEYSIWLGAEYADFPVYGMGDLLSYVTIVLAASFSASVAATVLSHLNRRVPGIFTATLSAILLLVSAVLFYRGVVDRFGIFEGWTQLNRSWSAVAAPMPGWWMAVIGPIVPAVQAATMALSLRREHAK